jgi:DegV family protein with EDD domain
MEKVRGRTTGVSVPRSSRATGSLCVVPGVLVVTDSSTCLPVDLVSSLGIRVLPISVHLPDGDLQAGPDGAGEKFQLPEALELEELAGANHPFVTEYLEAIEEPGFDAAVIITPAIEFASMFRNASLASELSNQTSVAIDARSAAAGQALVVLSGAAAAQAGATLEEVVAIVKDATRRVELVASLASLDAIRRSGPVPESLLVGNETVGTRSVFRMHDGVIESLAETTSSAGALDVIRTAFAEHGGEGIERSTVFHAGASALAAELATMLGGVDFISGFSIAMQIHTGPGVVGAAWLPVKS